MQQRGARWERFRHFACLGDDCFGLGVPLNDQFTFTALTVAPTPPTPMDSLTAAGCSSVTWQLVFKKPIQCSSIAPDGSDFIITGPAPVVIQSASGHCINGSSTVILLNLASPVVSSGIYQVRLVNGSDGNTLIDDCDRQTPAGSVLSMDIGSCFIGVPAAFTPNGDGHNDFLYPLNADKAVNLEFKVYNRYGQLVFETRDGAKKWDGTLKGKAQNTGTYIWTLQYTDGETGKKIVSRGTSILIR
jgi:gliding motility-associated-like protein